MTTRWIAAATMALFCSTAFAGGLLPNGDFQRGMSGWVLEKHGGAEATSEVVDLPDGRRALQIDIQKPGTQNWHIQLAYYGVPALKVGGRYPLKLSIMSDASDVKASVVFGEVGAKYAAMTGYWTFKLPSELRELKHVFTIKREAEKRRLVIGNLGLAKGRVVITDVELLPQQKAEAGYEDAAARAAREAALAARAQGIVEVRVDPMPRQTIGGWGSHAAGMHDWSKTRQAHLGREDAVKAFYGLGQTIVRATLRHDAVWKEDGTLGGYHSLSQLLRTAQEHGVKNYILSVWSPPAALKEPAIVSGYRDDNGNGRRDEAEPISRLREDREDEFVARYIRAIKTLESDGLGLPLNISIQNEPNEVPSYEGCAYMPDQLARVTQKMRQALDEAGLSQVGIIGPDSNYGAVIKLWWGIHKDHPGYLGGVGFPTLEENPAYRESLAGYAWHSYNMSFMSQIAAGVAETPKACWMTERSDPSGRDELEWGISLGRHLLADLIEVPNEYWFYWNTIQIRDKALGRTSFVVAKSDGTVQLSKQAQLLKGLWTRVTPGWRVHQIRSNHADLRTSGAGQDHTVFVDAAAFTSPDDSSTAVLLLRGRGERSEPGLRVMGLTGTSAKVYRLDAENEMIDPILELPVKRGSVELPPMPELSATLVVSK